MDRGMNKASTKRARADGAFKHDEAPPVLALMADMTRPRAAIMARLREAVLSLPGVEERTLYDGFCREWTPAYYAGSRQLFHVHNFRSWLRATMFVGIRTLEPFLLESDQVAPELLELVAATSGNRATKMVKVPLDSKEDIAPLMELVRRKWEFGEVATAHG